MEAHDDLRKFITECAVTQVAVVLSSGRGADNEAGGSTEHREIVGRLTPWAGIESSMAMGSVQTAAEALQEAETEVGVVAVRAGGSVRRSADPTTGVGLMD